MIILLEFHYSCIALFCVLFSTAHMLTVRKCNAEDISRTENLDTIRDSVYLRHLVINEISHNDQDIYLNTKHGSIINLGSHNLNGPRNESHSWPYINHNAGNCDANTSYIMLMRLESHFFYVNIDKVTLLTKCKTMHGFKKCKQFRRFYY